MYFCVVERRAVAEQFLNGAQVGAVLQQMCGKGVAKAVRMNGVVAARSTSRRI